MISDYAVGPYGWVMQTVFVGLSAGSTILKLYGPERGAHSRSAVGLAELPFDIPVEIEGEVELYG